MKRLYEKPILGIHAYALFEDVFLAGGGCNHLAGNNQQGCDNNQTNPGS